MPRKNRAYKKGAPHRDARLFIIVAEGEREDGYFGWFHERNQRVSVRIVPREAGFSAPAHFLARVNQFIEEGGWRQEDNDMLWFVLDVDQWQREELENLNIACQHASNWNIAVSNPCFEVWLLYHFFETLPDDGAPCSSLKQRLHEAVQGGYDKETFCRKIKVAANNAKLADDNTTGYFPDRMKTKLYLLAEEIISLLGRNWEEGQ